MRCQLVPRVPENAAWKVLRSEKGSTIFIERMDSSHSKSVPAQEGLAYLQSILDTVRDPMLVLDNGLRVVTASRAFCRVFQVTQEETEGQLVYQLGSGQWDIPALRQALEVVLPQQTSFDDFEVTPHFAALGPRTMLLNARKIWREQNHTELILLAMEDITERKAAADQLATLRQELERSNADLEAFARIAGHDLRAPLNSIVQFSQLLERRLRGTLDEESQIFFHHIIEGGQRISQLLTDLLKYALLSSAPVQPATSVVLQQACQLAQENLHTAIEESGAQVTCGMADEVRVPVENSRLVQLFQNLVGNAIHYRRSSVVPVIQIQAQSQGSHWLVSVSDNGVGIEPRYLQEIFQPFRRLHGPERSGSGIGLATCQRIVERAEGTIWADSIPGQGSTFFVLLPKAT